MYWTRQWRRSLRMARAAWTGFIEAAREIVEQGTFTNLAQAVAFAHINESFEP